MLPGWWLLVALFWLPPVPAMNLQPALPAPAFTHTAAEAWLNSPPLTLKGLRGRVVLLDFWTFDCWNCYRSFPWLQGLETRLAGQPFTVIGVHTPEFAHERDRERLEQKVKEFRLTHPIMMDNDFSYWNATGTRFWPTFHLLDKRGRMRAVFFGETHEGDERARRIEESIRELLQE